MQPTGNAVELLGDEDRGSCFLGYKYSMGRTWEKESGNQENSNGDSSAEGLCLSTPPCTHSCEPRRPAVPDPQTLQFSSYCWFYFIYLFFLFALKSSRGDELEIFLLVCVLYILTL